MYYLKRHFTFAGGHRLTKHQGLCKNFHGHNYDVWVTVRSPHLDKNDMVMDFSTLKDHVNPIIRSFDHALLVNSVDLDSLKDFEEKGMRIFTLGPYDPTAERIAEYIYVRLKEIFTINFNQIEIDQVEVFENVQSSAIYRGD
jgi:6-pyruvoyltetrahydropterin/6-carboxytetrahydropterin synthase